MGFEGRRYLVAGARVAGIASAEALLRRGAVVTVVDRSAGEWVDRLTTAGAEALVSDEPPTDLLDRVDEIVVSPGFPPHHPLAVAARSRGIEVYSEPELAWRLRPADAAPWLAVTGTNGKTTTTTMLVSILRAAGLRTEALGNIGVPLVDAVASDLDVLAVELSSFQLHWSSTLAPHAGAWLNLADDHLEWHGDFEHYATAKKAVWRGPVAVGNLDDPYVARELRAHEGRTIGFTLDAPRQGNLGVVEHMLIDRIGDGDAHEIAVLDDVKPSGPHNVANALAAAALALAHGVDREAIRAGLSGYVPEPHRNAPVATVDGVLYVDDSKATNPHAAYASLRSYPKVVWVAGGQLKGVDVDDLVAAVAGRLSGAVLIGVDRAELADALARHAPDVPVVDVPRTDDGAMAEAVTAAARLARPGDTVLLAPAAASLDMYTSYAARGAAFETAVRGLRQ
ncbi:UDP-N-acetylmuramoylalanine--D-glutamate ligase [Longispora fulva]|uniref:UDP-N-acetylmuramoylalanine--D-glutamate ligase n=1 Tax=Longispora fulva TaxID=619741 RepID=A0A8J7KTW5_9ACTN|nr:UDP-N-acetylmuramoyl-L-alanine--D-glutamate ligase [Longispora fulva]MBG6141192.1 UDP-N-acetylmuramoylalanine--D-glutamate ligase [Longispora fulva]GIG62812.1 UDP-N-acetylmuramoylalanine--D-glutamate ligase [Longispora fulva]